MDFIIGRHPSSLAGFEYQWRTRYALLDIPSFLTQFANFTQEYANLGAASIAEFIILSEMNVDCLVYPDERTP